MPVGIITGVSWGMVASPFCLGLYSLSYIPVIGLIGFLGLALSLLHGTPGFEIATLMGCGRQQAS